MNVSSLPGYADSNAVATRLPEEPLSIPGKWTPYLLSVARIIFGFLILRHGMEQVLGVPRASAATGVLPILEWLALPGGILLMLGLFTRQVCMVLAPAYIVYWFAGPVYSALTVGAPLVGGRGPSDPLLANGFFLLYVVAAGPGAWSLDWLRDPTAAARKADWAPYALDALRIVVAFLFIQHGVPKLFGPRPTALLSQRGIAGILEFGGGLLLMGGVFTRPLAFLLSGEMAVAYFMSNAPDGFWESFETPTKEASILNCFAFLFLWAAGSGPFSVDGLLRRRRERSSSMAAGAPPSPGGPSRLLKK